MLVRIGDVFRIGRPVRCVEERGTFPQIDDLGRCEAVLVAHLKLVFTGGVAEVGDRLAVGGPCGIALEGARCSGEVARIALLGRHREDVTARLDEDACSGRREVDALHGRGCDLRQSRPQRRQVAADRDVEYALRAGGEVEQVERAELLIDERARTRVQGLEVEAVVRDHGLDAPGRGVVFEQRHRTVAVREEIHALADPDGCKVIRVFARNLHEVEGLQVDEPHRRRLPASVAFPRPLPLHHRHVGEGASILGQAPLARARQRQQRRQTGAVGVNTQQPRKIGVTGAEGLDQHVLAVRGPADRSFTGGVPGQAPRHSARRIDHVDVVRAAGFDGVRDLQAVGRIIRAGRHGVHRRQSFRVAAFPCDRPNIAAIEERDAIPVERGIAQQQGRWGLGVTRGGSDTQREQMEHGECTQRRNQTHGIPR